MDSDAKYRAYLCCGPNCGPKGSPALLDFLEEEVKRLGLEERVSVIAGSCMSHCDSGPSMVVYPGPVFYEEVDRDRLRRIVKEHLAGDRPVAEYRWEQPSKRRQFPRSPQPHFTPSPAGNAPYSHHERDHKPPKPKKTYDVDDFKW